MDPALILKSSEIVELNVKAKPYYEKNHIEYVKYDHYSFVEHPKQTISKKSYEEMTIYFGVNPDIVDQYYTVSYD